MKIHQQTVDTYLEDILLDSVEFSAGVQARNEVRRYADRVSLFVDEIDKKYIVIFYIYIYIYMCVCVLKI